MIYRKPRKPLLTSILSASTMKNTSDWLDKPCHSYALFGGGRVVRMCWINFQCRGVQLTWIVVGQGPIVLAVGAGWGCLDIFSLIYHFSFLSPSLWETARYRLKYCLKWPLSPNQPNPTLFLVSPGKLDIKRH